MHDPRLLYSINNIRAHHLQNGEETELTPSSPQTLALLMVSTSSRRPGVPNLDGHPEMSEEDFYLHLHLPPGLDMPLPAKTKIYHQPPNSYLIPRWDLGPDSGGFLRLQFPSIGIGLDKHSSNARLPPKRPAAYHTAHNAPGEGDISSADSRLGESHGKIVLVDEEDGSGFGELTDGYEIVEKPGVKPDQKYPVEILLPVEGEGNQIKCQQYF
ncbi:hypothetical protein V1522DRAFT_440718 [Lipomyces starkeyi]